MKQSKQSQDVEQIINGNIQDKELKELNVALKNYIKARGFDKHDSKDQVDLTLVIFSMLDVTEEEFTEYISRLNVLQLQRMQVIKSTESGNTH